MPRVGVAYQLSRSTVLRGGWGMYYGPLGTQRGDVVQSGFSRSTQLIPSIDNGLNFIATLSNPFPNGIEEPQGAAGGMMTFAGRAIEFFNPDPQAPRQMRWSLGLQHQFPTGILLEASYVANRGSMMETTRDYRSLPQQYLSKSPVRDQTHYNYLTQPVANPFYPLLPDTGLAGQNTTRAYLLTSGDFPHFTGLTSTDNLGYTWYHSLQVKSERRFSAGWTMSVAYTWSKFMQALSRLNGYSSSLEHVVSDQDVPPGFRSAVSGSCRLVRARGSWVRCRPAANKIVGGWQVQGVYVGQSGRAWASETGCSWGISTTSHCRKPT